MSFERPLLFMAIGGGPGLAFVWINNMGHRMDIWITLVFWTVIWGILGVSVDLHSQGSHFEKSVNLALKILLPIGLLMLLFLGPTS